MTSPIDAQPVHRCFTVDATAYLRNLDRDDLKARCVAVHYQRPPTKTEGGTSIGLRFPMLIVAGYLEDPDAVAAKVADILERHWDAGDQPDAADERAVIVRYMRHMATLRPADAHGLRVIASDVEALFHRDPELNPEGPAA